MGNVRTRFAPSPTGFLHIGSLRAAIFNWLYARAQGGKFLLRIEDTDPARSTEEFKNAIFKGLKWIGIESDEPWVLQSNNFDIHRKVAEELLKNGKAYYCYCSKEELEDMRKKAAEKKEAFKYNRNCLLNPKKIPGRNPVIRLKAETEGFTEFDDLVQGHIKINNQQMDDMVLIRSDGSPTYMLSVVIDDINMGITHVIRGDDHLTNTFRQIQLYKAIGANIPYFAHIPLIHGPDGTKLSKRHGAVDVMEYQKMGILPEAFFNYLIRLGWAHGDDEVISLEDAIKWFDIKDVGRSPSRFDINKLLYLNGVYIRAASDSRLMQFFPDLKEPFLSMLKSGLNGIKERSKTINDLIKGAKIYLSNEIEISDDAKTVTSNNTDYLNIAIELLSKCNDISHDSLENIFRSYSTQHQIKLGDIAKPIRCAITGELISPSIFEIISILGKEITINRIKKAINI